jgi:hypothetical protein
LEGILAPNFTYVNATEVSPKFESFSMNESEGIVLWQAFRQAFSLAGVFSDNFANVDAA